jgi:hypothetical protein
VPVQVAPPAFFELSQVTENLGRSSIGWDPLKDTPRYFCLMRHRIEWMRAAAAVAPADTVLTWIDMGIPQCGEPPAGLLASVLNRPPPPGKIRLCEISYVPRDAVADVDRYYQRHWWPVGGGLWAARRPEIEWLAEQIAAEWRVVLDAGHVATDEMLIGRIALQHPERFDVYYGDHPTLLTNWESVKASHRLVAEMALRALEDQNVEAARARFQALADGLR